MQGLPEVAAIVAELSAVMARVLAVVEKVLERLAADSSTLGVAYPVGHHQEIACVLVEELVGLGVERVGGRIPHDLIDSDGVSAVAVVVAQAHEEHRAAAHGGHVDGSGKRNRQAWLQVEAVERIDDVDVRAVRHADGAVGLGQAYAQPGLLLVVVDREAVARERCARGRGQVEQCLDCEREARNQDQDGGGDGDEAAVLRTHGEPPSVTTALLGHDAETAKEYHARIAGVNRPA